MKDYIKSKIAGFSFLLLLSMLIVVFGISIFIPRLIKLSTESIGGFLILLLFIGLYLLAINFLKHIRYLQIKDNELKYWSLFVPFGKTLYFDNYIGKIIETESGSGGSYKVVYLVDKKNRTTFKMMGLHYKNFDEMNNAIPLKKISFSSSVGQYFKLLFFERVTVENTPKSTNDKSAHKIAKIFAVISAIGVALFVLGMLIRILSKIL
jgi:hypothetical protein